MHTSTLKHFTLSHLLYDYRHLHTHLHTVSTPHTHTPTVWHITTHTEQMKKWQQQQEHLRKCPNLVGGGGSSLKVPLLHFFFQVWKCLCYINVTLKSTKAKESLCDLDIRFALMLQHGWLSNKYVTNPVVKLTPKDFPYKCSVQGKAKMRPFD